MVFLRPVELTERLDLGDHAATPGFVRPFARRLEQLPLLVVPVVHRGTVLSADVVALSVQLTGVVQGEEHVEDHVVRNHFRVEGHGDGFGVAGRARAHGLIGGFGNSATGIAGDNVGHAFQGAVHRVEAPEASAGEYESVHPWNLLSAASSSLIATPDASSQFPQAVPRVGGTL